MPYLSQPWGSEQEAPHFQVQSLPEFLTLLLALTSAHGEETHAQLLSGEQTSFSAAGKGPRPRHV